MHLPNGSENILLQLNLDLFVHFFNFELVFFKYLYFKKILKK